MNTTTTITLRDLYAENDLQQEIIDDLSDCGLDADEQITALRDLASGCDPLYQFFGMIVTEQHVVHTYERLKLAIVDQINTLHDQGMDVRDYMRREAFTDVRDYRTPSYTDWASAALSAAIWGAAGDLYSQVEAFEYA